MSNQQRPVIALFSSGNMSSNLTSPVIDVRSNDNIGIELVWTGVPVGTFSVQVSEDYQQNDSGGVVLAGDWITLSLENPISANGSADSAYIDINQLAAPWLRVVYTATSGSGSLNGYLSAKGL